jgi:biotin carboxyl carrier protein
MKKFKFTINGNDYDVEILQVEDNIAKVEMNGALYEVGLHSEPRQGKTPALARPESPKPTPREQRIQKVQATTTNSAVKAPLPGTVLQVLVRAGDRVTIGQKLLTMEAMKMENNVVSEKDGQVRAVFVKPGDTVLQNDLLAEID